MGVDKQLLEKYHLGQCTADERLRVEKWLADDTLELEGLPDLPAAQKDGTRQAIWTNVASHLDHTEAPATSRRKPATRRVAIWTAAGIAASVALLVWVWPSVMTSSQTFYDNSANTAPVWFKGAGFDVLLGEASRATIDVRAGVLEVEGNLLFRPKRDIRIRQHHGQTMLRRGETYIILEGTDAEGQFILTKGEMTFLPPPMQRKLKQQLNIS